MSKKFRRRPSPALAISIVALFLAASGTAVAASKMVSGNSLIKVNSLSGNRLKNGSVTGKQINVNLLGEVPRAESANTATTANTAASAPISNVTYVTATGTIVPGAGSALLVTASCPSGTDVIGGGAHVSDENDAIVNDSYDNGTSGWSADFYGGNVSSTATVTAICAPAAATTGS